MARETSKRARQASRPSALGRSSLPNWIWGLAGLSIGLFVALLVQLHHSAPNNTEAVTSLFQPQESDIDSSIGPTTGRTSIPNEPIQPRFEFYKLLPDQEVEVPAPEPNLAIPMAKPPTAAGHRSNAEHPRPQTATALPRESGPTNASYLLQVGSFRNLDDADQLKARLALLGVEASIQNAELAGGGTWHRVRIGPFSDREHLNAIRKRLQADNIHAILLKRGG
ncbi:SPOR domain-containing protein [Nitrococcus mobilis]|uniref:Sporulation-like protein n=1 Tax=Nitrococcus mobilis Nb-231 TaxID=314278 RepID=A4BMX8_9GAMM|nr:SPOR domain-containing protein [Nitrococcus mobilis]EAR22577.1 Sporulation-like protein [Nitrococcus mobilis Nb-231]